jgi:hypothetical protein
MAMIKSPDTSLKVVAIKYWQNHLNGFDPCYLPPLSDGINIEKQEIQHHTTKIDIQTSDAAIHEFCASNGVTLSELLQTAWSIVLHSYADVNEGCFEYVAPDHADTFENGLGAPAGMYSYISRFKFQDETTLRMIMGEMHANYVASLENQSVSIDEIHHSLGFNGERLFNSRLSFCERRPSSEVIQSAKRDEEEVCISFLLKI